MKRQKRSYFFGPKGSGYGKFSTQNEPTQNIFKELFDSQAFIAEPADTATKETQGLIKLATDDETIAGSIPSGEYAKATQSHQLPQLDAGPPIVTDPASWESISSLEGWGITIKKVKQYINSVYSRTVYYLQNTLELTSVDESITVTTTATGYDLSVKTLQGDPGNDGNDGSTPSIVIEDRVVIFMIASDCEGHVTDYSNAYIDIQVTDPATSDYKDTANLSLTISPASNELTIKYSWSKLNSDTLRILIESIADDVDSGILNVIVTETIDDTEIVYPLKRYSIIKNIPQCAPDSFTYKGVLQTYPESAKNMDWFKSSKSGRSYFYNEETDNWNLLFPNGHDEGPMQTHTLTTSGGTITLDASDASSHILRTSIVSGDYNLAAPIVIEPTGDFEDGAKFIFHVRTDFNLSGQTFTIFGKTLTDIEAGCGESMATTVYDATGDEWFVYIIHDSKYDEVVPT
jgi:hypothetical protein